MASLLSRLFGKPREPITIRAQIVVIDRNVLNDGSRPIDVDAEEVLLLGNEIPAPWYQRPVGIVVLSVIAIVIASLILAGIAALAGW